MKEALIAGITDQDERITGYLNKQERVKLAYLDRRYYDKRWTAEFLKQVAESGI